MRGQVEADVPIVMHGVVDLAVTGLAEVEGPPAVQLLAVGVVAYLCASGTGGRGGTKLSQCWFGQQGLEVHLLGDRAESQAH